MNYSKVLVAEAEVILIGLNGIFNESFADAEDIGKYHVKTFNTTESALFYIDRHQDDCDLIRAFVCDVNVLAETDYQFVKDIRSSSIYKGIPVIAINRGDDNAIDCRKAIENGVDDCYKVPVSWSDLQSRIDSLRKFYSIQSAPRDYKRESLQEVYQTPGGKRIFDILFASLAIIAFSIPMILIAIAIKLSSKGDILYRSKRIGSGYKEFDFLKFRSMVPDADQLVEKLKKDNAYGEDAVFFKMKKDPRVTTIGKFIRRTSLDELPQLFNVLFGDMSIVGNRPLPVKEAEALTNEEWSERFLAPAGITGKWQTIGPTKDTMKMEKRIALDIAYAREYSAWEDLKILFKTFRAMKQQPDA